VLLCIALLQLYFASKLSRIDQQVVSSRYECKRATAQGALSHTFAKNTTVHYARFTPIHTSLPVPGMGMLVVVGGLRSDTFIPRISNLILRDLSG
jgi:hypothetical protein